MRFAPLMKPHNAINKNTKKTYAAQRDFIERVKVRSREGVRIAEATQKKRLRRPIGASSLGDSMEKRTGPVSNKLTPDRIQIVFQDEPISYPPNGNYESSEAIRTMYGFDASTLKTSIESLTKEMKITITADVAIGAGAPSEGWLIDLYKLVTPKAVEIAAWIVIGQTVYKICKELRKALRKEGYRNGRPMLSMVAVESLAIKRFMRFKRKNAYYIDRIELFNGVNAGVYEPWDVYMITIGKFNSERTTVLFYNCFGKQIGRALFKMKRKYQRSPSDD